MFGKIKDRLKNVFKKSEEVVDDNEDIVEEVVDNQIIEEKTQKKESKEQKEEDLIEEIQEDMLDGVEKEEKEAILEKKELPKEEVEEHKKEIEEQIESEEKLEEDLMEQIDEKEEENKQKEKLKKDFVEDKIKEEPKKKESKKGKQQIVEEKEEVQEQVEEQEEKPKEEKKGFFSKALDSLKSREITQDDFDKIWVELEIFLLEINIAFEIVEKIETRLREELIGHSFNRFKISQKIREVLIDEVTQVLESREDNLIQEIKDINKEGKVAKIMILGVNGTGKTTSIAKIVNFLQKEDLSVVVSASDTFRAAANEQLEEHAKKLGFKLIQHKGGSDPAAVAFDAIEHAKAKNLNVALIDTAGRMPNNSNLMVELEKIKRVSKSNLNIFIGDSVSGNDLIDQINLFDQGVGISGVILTKVDTDERPGSIVTTAYSIEKPIYFLGIGQTYDDLIEFNAKHVAEKLFDIDDEN